MEELKTDSLSDYSKNPTQTTELDSSKNQDNNGTAGLLNGCEEIEELDLMESCENVGSPNSDVWKGSDSEEESVEHTKSSSDLAEQKESKDNDETNETEEVQTVDDVSKPTESEKENVDEPEAKTTDENQIDQQREENQSDVIEIPEQEEVQTVEEPTEIINDSIENQQDKEPVDEVQIVEEVAENNAENSSPEKSSDINQANEDGDADANKETPKENDITDKDFSAQDTNSDKDVTIIESEQDPLATDVDPLALDTSPEKEPSTSRPPNRNNDDQDQDDCQMEYDAEDDDDFDPSLLCPELSMEVDENPVITTNSSLPHDGSASPTLCEPLHSTFVDEVTGAEINFNLSAEEFELKKSLYPPTNSIQNGRIHCTACNVHLGSALEGQHNRFVHPLLKVLICKDCYHFYTSGEFEKDEDGSELYCRWCGQGGQVLCCSKCEYVFCKKCIRTNFGRKKMFEIRDSDAWDCFRCNMVQIMTQRVACFEFFEYVRREMQRAATLNSSEVWGVDYTRCCSYKKRPAENNENQESKKVKKRKSNMDPDYDPLAEKTVETPPQTGVITIGLQTSHTSTPGLKKFVIPKPMAYVSRVTNKQKDNDIEFVRTIPPPQLGMNSIRPQNNSMPMYRTIFPSQYRPVVQPTVLRLTSPMAPLLPTGNRILSNTLQNRPVVTSNLMKHEWFEKTVRAAARVNSHLSYTLTQLNKAQSQAASVEELAVVHNKLQEILSSSINSLIQIRKNLRTEFISGIKTVRLPSRKPETFTNDDDVIIVSAPSMMPMPSASLPPLASMASMAPNPPRTDSVLHIDNTTNRTTPPEGLNLNKPSSSSVTPTSAVGGEKPISYLKVKSFSDLQNVPSECITIPDDVPTTSGMANNIPVVEIACNGTSVVQPKEINSNNKTSDKSITPTKSGTNDKAKDKTTVGPTKSVTNDKTKCSKDKTTTPAKSDSDLKNGEVTPNKRNKESAGSNLRDLRTRNKAEESMVFNAKNLSSPEAKRMFSVTVNLEKVDLQKLQKRLIK